VLATGAAVVPLAAGAPEVERARVLARTGIDALILDAPPPATAGAPACFVVSACTLAPAGGPALRAARAAAPGPDAPAIVTWSPGTTAGPYLVHRTHRNLVAEGDAFVTGAGLGVDDACLGLVPLSHAYGLGTLLLASLCAGARLVLRPRFARRETLDLVAAERITVLPLVPFMAHMLTTVERGRPFDRAALRLCLTAGASLPRATWDAFRARFGLPLRQLYGLTEAGEVSMSGGPDDAVEPASVGTPLPGVRVAVLGDDGRPATPGVVGDIVVWSPAAARGAAAPLPTGDRGRWTKTGELVLTGRSSAFINNAGNKVDPAEVEAILRLHPAVADAHVVGEPDRLLEQLVTADVRLRDPVAADALRTHCREHLAGYKIPRVLRLVGPD
jgi:long-chain acyl-CoA synthetase